MRVLRLGLLVLVGAMALVSPACSEKLTTDPNAPGISQTSPEQKPDPRLSQKVTYQAKGKMVSQILDDLSKLTGVSFKAGYNKLDWQVRDRKMLIHAKDLPLSELMASMARTMKFTWRRSEDTQPPSYRLFMNRKLLLEANAMLRKQQEERKRELAAKRATKVAWMMGEGDLSPQDIEKLKDVDPVMYAYASTGALKPLVEFLRSAPDVYDALLAGEEVAFRASSLPSAAQQALPKWAEGSVKATERFWVQPETAPQYLPFSLDQAIIRVNPGLADLFEDPELWYQQLGKVSWSCGDQGDEFFLLNPDDISGAIANKMALRAHDEQRPWVDVFREMKDEYHQAIWRQLKEDDSGEPLIEHEDDPDLNAKVKVKVDKPQLPLCQEALAKASDFSVVSDYFGTRDDIASIPAGETPVKDILEKIQDQFHYNWDRHGSVIEFRDRFWYAKRAAQIPEAWMEKWRKMLRETGTLDIDCLSEIACLTPAQDWLNIWEDEFMAGQVARELGAISWVARALLKTHSLLDTQQRKMLFSEAGLDLGSLSAEQWAPMRKALCGMRSEYALEPYPKTNVRATRTPKGKQFEYSFIVTSPDIPEPIVERFDSPKYEPPKTLEPKSGAQEQPK